MTTPRLALLVARLGPGPCFAARTELCIPPTCVCACAADLEQAAEQWRAFLPALPVGRDSSRADKDLRKEVGGGREVRMLCDVCVGAVCARQVSMEASRLLGRAWALMLHPMALSALPY